MLDYFKDWKQEDSSSEDEDEEYDDQDDSPQKSEFGNYLDINKLQSQGS
jgi:hypothetical protein